MSENRLGSCEQFEFCLCASFGISGDLPRIPGRLLSLSERLLYRAARFVNWTGEILFI